MEKRENVTNVGEMIRLVMCKLVNGDNFFVVEEHHRSKHRRGYRLHIIHVATSGQDIVIKWGVDNFDIDEDGFPPKFNWDILEEPCGVRLDTTISSHGDGRWY